MSRVASEVSVMPPHPVPGARRHGNAGTTDGAFASVLDQAAATPDRRETSARESTSDRKPESKDDKQTSPTEGKDTNRSAAANDTHSDPAPPQADGNADSPPAKTDQTLSPEGQDPAVVATTVDDPGDSAGKNKKPTDPGIDAAAAGDLALADQTQTTEQQPPAVPVQAPAPAVSPPALPANEEIAALDVAQKRPPAAADPSADPGDQKAAEGSVGNGRGAAHRGHGASAAHARGRSEGNGAGTDGTDGPPGRRDRRTDREQQ